MITHQQRMHPILSALLLCIITAATLASGQSPAPSFVPADNFLVDCGATDAVVMPDGRDFKNDQQAASMLKAKDELRVAVPSHSVDVPSPLYLSARIFHEDATYSFHLTRPGWHWIRLHFFPLKNSDSDLRQAVFSVATNDYVLLHSFNMDDGDSWALKEYLVNATADRINLRFTPLRNSVAFVNGIEVVSAPDQLISDSASTLYPVGDASGLSGYAYETIYRVNVGGPVITPVNDTLGRYWVPDDGYLLERSKAKTISLENPTAIQYPEDGSSSLIAPNWVYASTVEMADARVGETRFNVTWKLDVDPSFGYLVRLHFCDIISESLNDLYFDVYINEMTAISGLDLSTLTGGLAKAYYRDFVLNASMASDYILLQIGPMKEDTGKIQALLNGLEVLKMSNSVASLDGEFGVDGSEVAGGNASRRRVVVTVGAAMMFGAFAGLSAMVVKWQKSPDDWEKKNSFSSWLLPIQTGHSSFMNSKGSGFSSHKSGYTFSSTLGLGRYFSFAELQEATKSFDQNAVIGVGGFGNVYLGELDDGTKVAVKRGNPQSEQGINEFQTEIQMLSKLRHRHLVSLIGYCDENSEMILVYEYMANGPFRDHLYGKNLLPMTWKQRLEICIGAARGLHYLHTGTASGIIHRDVKTTNILLDENLVAKVSDFGLSKDAPGMNQAHVSTAVKGSFGYLDPEYFRRQQLTDKSDVYSFGVVMLEVLCARPALDPALPREQVNLAEWAMQWKRKGLLEKIVDVNIAGTITWESMAKFAEAAEKCLVEHGVDRPSMGDVLWNLEYALQLQEVSPPTPPKPLAPVEKGREDDEKQDAGASAKKEGGDEETAMSQQQAVEDSGTMVGNELLARLAGMTGS